MRIIRPVNGYDEQRLSEDIMRLREAYPFLESETVGRSVLGTPIRLIRIGSGPNKVHLNAAFHANEWITSMLLMAFAEELAERVRQGDDVSELLTQVQADLVPMVNPDGVELAVGGLRSDHPCRDQLLQYNDYSEDFTGWKANVRGVDLNDQFPAHWEDEARRRGPEGPSPRDYVGEEPLSEPEARALAELTIQRDYRTVVALHTQGEEIYWNYRGYEPAYAKEWASRLGEASGYAPIRLTGSDAGFKDWFIQRFGRPGFTVEAGYGVNPLPYTDFETIYPRVRPMLLEVLRLAAKG